MDGERERIGERELWIKPEREDAGGRVFRNRMKSFMKKKGKWDGLTGIEGEDDDPRREGG